MKIFQDLLNTKSCVTLNNAKTRAGIKWAINLILFVPLITGGKILAWFPAFIFWLDHLPLKLFNPTSHPPPPPPIIVRVFRLFLTVGTSYWVIYGNVLPYHLTKEKWRHWVRFLKIWVTRWVNHYFPLWPSDSQLWNEDIA